MIAALTRSRWDERVCRSQSTVPWCWWQIAGMIFTSHVSSVRNGSASHTKTFRRPWITRQNESPWAQNNIAIQKVLRRKPWKHQAFRATFGKPPTDETYYKINHALRKSVVLHRRDGAPFFHSFNLRPRDGSRKCRPSSWRRLISWRQIRKLWSKVYIHRLRINDIRKGKNWRATDLYVTKHVDAGCAQTVSENAPSTTQRKILRKGSQCISPCWKADSISFSAPQMARLEK